jgi:hypothetical protein
MIYLRRTIERLSAKILKRSVPFIFFYFCKRLYFFKSDFFLHFAIKKLKIINYQLKQLIQLNNIKFTENIETIPKCVLNSRFENFRREKDALIPVL